MVETSGNGNASNLINLKRPFNNTRINASDIGTRHSDPKSIIPFGKHSILGHQNKHFHLFCFFCCISRRLTIKNEIFVLIFVVFVIKRRGQHVCFVFLNCNNNNNQSKEIWYLAFGFNQKKFSDILRRPQNFAKSPPYFCLYIL